MLRKFLSIVVFATISLTGFSQNDTIQFSKNQTLVGELKKMDRGVFGIETSYSDKDFAVDWSEVTYISSKSHFLITSKNGRRVDGYIETVGDRMLKITNKDGSEYNYAFDDIVFLNTIKDNFWDQAYATVDVGLNLTKANSYKQTSFNTSFGYIGKQWSADFLYSSLKSSQDSVQDTNRNNGSLVMKFFLRKDWYIMGSLSSLSNTEQNLNLRVNSTLGMGKYIIHTNSTYWGVSLGTNSNREEYFSDSEPSFSWEAVGGTELNLFDVGDLSLLTKVDVYYGFGENGRWRTDYNLNTKYDLPLNFYVNLNLSVNYDSRPSDGGSNTDYVITTGFGWSLD
jgi:hypothetical protein